MKTGSRNQNDRNGGNMEDNRCAFCGGELELKEITGNANEEIMIICQNCKARISRRILYKDRNPAEMEEARKKAARELRRAWSRRPGREPGQDPEGLLPCPLCGSEGKQEEHSLYEAYKDDPLLKDFILAIWVEIDRKTRPQEGQGAV